VRDSLEPAEVEPQLTGRFGRPYAYEAVCESTQRLLDPTLPEGAAALCDEQTEGRGRLGRGWIAPAGTAILCSVLLSPPPERRVAELALVGGIAVAETVEDATGLATQIKWPNDVMLNRRKVAGILAEATGDHVVLGIGLNVNQTRDQLPLDAGTPPASLYTIDAVRRQRAPLLAMLLAALERHYETWLEGGIALLYGELGPRDFLRGRKVYVDGREGWAIMIERDGTLAVEVDGETRRVESGEISYDR
jgi:BirA family biotin operon repressor/biotin-[acetyl-CoA-carboxylase] ligase